MSLSETLQNHKNARTTNMHEIKQLGELLSILSTHQREICEYALRLSGVIPFHECEPYINLPREVRRRGFEIAVEVAKNFKDVSLSKCKSQILRLYSPRIDSGFLTQQLGINFNGRDCVFFKVGGIHYTYRDDHENGQWFKGFGVKKGGEAPVFFLARQRGIKVFEVMDDYYRWLYGSKTLDETVRDYALSNEAVRNVLAAVEESCEEVEQLHDEETSVPEPAAPVPCQCDEFRPEEWKPEELKLGRAFYVQNYLKLNGSFISDNHGPSLDKVYGNMNHGLLPEWQRRNIAEVKEWLLSRGMDKAVNRPEKWRIDRFDGAVIYEGWYTLCGGRRKDTVRDAKPVRVAYLKRQVVERRGKKQKGLENGSTAIPFLLQNVKLNDNSLYVLEGVPDACFVENGVAINNWCPSSLQRAIIGHFAKDRVGKGKVKKGMRVVYVSDNWVVGDKGGAAALEHWQKTAPETLMFDWTEFCSDYRDIKSKDIGELVMEMIARKKDGFITENGDYRMPREVLERYTKRACDICLANEVSFDELYNESKQNNL